MATASRALNTVDDPVSRIVKFLKVELKLYPGRGLAIIHMVIAASLTMILIETFQIHGGGLGALYTFFIARDDLQTTIKSATAVLASYAVGLCFVLVGANLFADEPSGRFIWFSVSIFVVFFVIKTVDVFNAGTAFALLVVNTLPGWLTVHVAEPQVERTLDQALAVAVGTLVAVAVEVVSHSFHPKAELFERLEDRWSSVKDVLTCYEEGAPVPEKLMSRFDAFAIAGSSDLRRIVGRSNYSPQYREQMTAVVALTGRLMEIGSTMVKMSYKLTEDDHELIAYALRQLDEIGTAIVKKKIPVLYDVTYTGMSGIPLLPEFVRTIRLIPQVFSGDEPSSVYIPSSLDVNSNYGIFVRDAFTNPDNLKFALRGCLAATLCYFAYNIFDWQGLTTSVATCAVTALSNVGASRQKQLLRITGAATGGFLFGIGSQAFLLPHFDSITQFLLLFASVTAIAAWFNTSSPRLSYFGLQLAQGFYLVLLEDFTIPTSLAVARNRVVGILLGLMVMWVVFDRIWAKPAAEEMMDVFISNLRLIARLTEDSITDDPDADIRRIRHTRSTIADNFQTVNAQADAIPFEFRKSHSAHMVARSYIKRWQPSLRTLYLMELSLLQHRLFGASAELPVNIVTAQNRFNEACAQALIAMADKIQGKQVAFQGNELDVALKALEDELQVIKTQSEGVILARVYGLVHLSEQIKDLLQQIFQEVMAAPSEGPLLQGIPREIHASS